MKNVFKTKDITPAINMPIIHFRTARSVLSGDSDISKSSLVTRFIDNVIFLVL